MIKPKPYVITIVGAESSGKTSLAAYLSTHYNGVLVPEYAREYLAELERAYQVNDLGIMATIEKARLDDAISGVFQSDSGTEDEVHLFEEQYSSLISIIQRHLFEKGDKSKSIIIVDGGLLTLRMWSRIKYGVEIKEVEDALNYDVSDLYLLCRPRREWTWDEMREAPSLVERSWIYNQYLDELVRMKVLFEIVDLNGGEK